MRTHNYKLEHANVVGVFDTQDEAEEGVLGLRAAGFRDRQIGYLARNLTGLVTDYLGRTYLVAGTVIGVILGAVLGVGLGRVALAIGATRFGPAFMPGADGMMMTWAVCGAIFLGITGAMIGWGVPQGDAVHSGRKSSPAGTSSRWTLATGKTWRGPPFASTEAANLELPKSKPPPPPATCRVGLR